MLCAAFLTRKPFGKHILPSQKSRDNIQFLVIIFNYLVAVNHMNYDVAEVNGSDPPMLPGSFLCEKEPGYEANGRALCFAAGLLCTMAKSTVRIAMTQK